MAFLNFYFNRLAYSDSLPVQNPKQQNFNFSTASEGLEAKYPSSGMQDIPPGQEVLLSSNARSLPTGLSSSEFEIRLIPETGRTRIRWTGNGPTPSFRQLRNINYGTIPAITQYSAVRVSPTAVVLTLVGAAVSLSSVTVGDEVYLQSSEGFFTSPLNSNSTGTRYTILAVSGTSITVRDQGNISEEVNIPLGFDYDSVIRFMLSDGAQVGDKLRISSNAGFAIDNKSQDYEIFDVSDRDLVIYNPLVIPETVTSGSSDPFMVFERLINFLSIEANGPLKLKFNNGAEELQLFEYSPGACFFAASVSAVSVTAVNSTSHPISVTIQSCTL